MDEMRKLEGCMYDADHNDYSISLNKDSLQKVLDGESLKRNLFYSSHNYSVEEIQKWMRKELVIGLLGDNERYEVMSEILIKNNYKNSEVVVLNISKKLLENLIDFNGCAFSDSYDYRYNSRGDKVLFYVTNEGHNRLLLNDNIDFSNQLFENKFPE